MNDQLTLGDLTAKRLKRLSQIAANDAKAAAVRKAELEETIRTDAVVECRRCYIVLPYSQMLKHIERDDCKRPVRK